MKDPNTAIESVLDALRHGGRDLARNPKGAVRAAATQLLHMGFRPAAQRSDGVTYRIDGLARAADLTTRNIRAYQERGLLHAPRRSGRVSIYDGTHLARLRLIASMHERGYSTAHIREMLGAWEAGKDLADVLGIEQVLIEPWSDDKPTTMSAESLQKLVCGVDNVGKLIEAGLVRMQSDVALVERPRLVIAFAEMLTYGMSIDTVLELHRRVEPAIDEIGKSLVQVGADHVIAQFSDHGVPATDGDVADLVPMLIRVRSLAMTSVTASIAASLDRAVEDVLADYLAQLLDSRRSDKNAG